MTLDRACQDLKHWLRKESLINLNYFTYAVTPDLFLYGSTPDLFHFISSLGSSMSNLNSILKYTTKRISDRQELDELKSFAESHLKEGRTILQIIERAESNIAWLDRNYDTIVSWLKEVDI